MASGKLMDELAEASEDLVNMVYHAIQLNRDDLPGMLDEELQEIENCVSHLKDLAEQLKKENRRARVF